jgi:CRP-like cAMP-binding protein
MEELLAQHGFTGEEIDEFKSNALLIKCPKRSFLVREGEQHHFFYWAVKGVFRAGFTDKKGVDRTLVFFTPDTVPYVISYGSFVTQRPSLTFLETLEDGEVLSWHYDYIKKIQETNIKWLIFFKKQLDRLFAMREVKDLRAYTLTPEEHYLAFVEVYKDLVHRLPLQHIATYIGVSAEALSRIRSKLNKQAGKK